MECLGWNEKCGACKAPSTVRMGCLGIHQMSCHGSQTLGMASATLGLKSHNEMCLGLFCITTTAEGFDSASLLTQPTDIPPHPSSHTESFCCSLLESGSNTACAFVGQNHSPAGGGPGVFKAPWKRFASDSSCLRQLWKIPPGESKDTTDLNIHVVEPQEGT